MRFTLFALLFLVGCSKGHVRDTGIDPGENAVTPISEQRVAASEFKRQGIKIHYTFFGNIKAIETTGEAPVWGNSANAIRDAYRVAELEAKKSLNDFINKESISSTVSAQMISRNLEKAEDNKNNQFSTNWNPELTESDTDVSNGMPATGNANTAVRQDAMNIANKLNTIITVQARGILGGLYLVEGHPSNDGRTVTVVYRWDEEHTEMRIQVRALMAR